MEKYNPELDFMITQLKRKKFEDEIHEYIKQTRPEFGRVGIAVSKIGDKLLKEYTDAEIYYGATDRLIDSVLKGEKDDLLDSMLNDITEIENYISKLAKGNLSKAGAREIAITFYDNKHAKDKILDGVYNQSILQTIETYIFKEKSVEEETSRGQINSTKQKKQETELKTKVKKISYWKVAAWITSLTVVIAGSVFIYNHLQNVVQKNMVHQELASMVNIDNINLVEGNSYKIINNPGTEDDDVIAYHNDRIAQNIIDICKENPDFLDVSLSSVYNNMNLNKLENMDEIFRYLKSFSKDDESLKETFERLMICDCFLEYLLNTGYISPESNEYYIAKEAVKEYERHGSLDSLSKEHKTVIKKLLSNFENNISLYDNFGEPSTGGRK